MKIKEVELSSGNIVAIAIGVGLFILFINGHTTDVIKVLHELVKLFNQKK